MRPPQPVAPPVGSDDCHCWVWSEWEYRFFGSGVPFNVAFVVGRTSVPTLKTGAACCAL